MDVHATRECIRNCFEQSDCGRSFRDALAQDGLVLARGDRRDFLVVDSAGGVHALGKRIVGISAGHIRDRLTDLSGAALPTLEQARDAIAAINLVPPDNDAEPICRQAKRSQKSPREQKRPRDCATEKGNRAVGKELPLRESRTDLEDAQPVVPLDHVPTETPLPKGSFESKQTPIDQLSESPEPQSTGAVGNELMRPITGPQEQKGGAFSPDASAEPVSVTEALPQPEQHPPPAQGPPGQTVRLRDLFRAIVKQITARTPAAWPTSRKRRRDEMGGVFRKVALGLLRRVARIPPLHFLDPTWEPFTWLRLWDCNDPTGSDVHQDYPAATPTNHSPHL